MTETFDLLSSEELLDMTKYLTDNDKREIKELLNGMKENSQKNNPESATSDKYDKTRRLNGCGIIFNFETFNDAKMCPKRAGTQEDVKRLSEVFEKLDIDLPKDRIHENLAKNEMITKIIEFKAQTTLLSESNVLIVVILSHGLEGDQIMAFDRAFNLYDIIDMFTAEELSEMAGRPKIFLVQACRGDKVDHGVTVKEENMSNVCTDSAKEWVISKLPNCADICIAFSSHHGHKSFRETENGTWFIQELCNVLEEIDLTQNHLLDVLTVTNARVAARQTPKNRKQISSFYSTLTKRFFLKK